MAICLISKQMAICLLVLKLYLQVVDYGPFYQLWIMFQLFQSTDARPFMYKLHA